MHRVKDSISPDDLMAYVDGALDQSRRREVEAHLRVDPDAARFVNEINRQNTSLRAALDPILDEPVPQRLLAVAQRPSGWRHVAASVAIALVVGIGGGWTLHKGLNKEDAVAFVADALVDRAVLAHTIYAVRPEPALDLQSSDASTVAAWLSAETEMRTTVPRLSDLGYQLMGVRLMMGQTRPAGLLVYGDGNGQRLSLLLRYDLGEDVETGFRHQGTFGVVRWADGGHGFGLAANLPHDELEAIAQVVRAQIGYAARQASSWPHFVGSAAYIVANQQVKIEATRRRPAELLVLRDT